MRVAAALLLALTGCNAITAPAPAATLSKRSQPRDAVARLPVTRGGGGGGALAKRLPITEWLPALTREAALNDVLAGLTVAAMLIPQGMSYASIAGLSPIVGLYCYVPMLVSPRPRRNVLL